MLWSIKTKKSDKWFWFIENSNWEQFFFHASTMPGGYPEFESTPEGTQVEFEIATGQDGRTQAASVRVVDWGYQEENFN